MELIFGKLKSKEEERRYTVSQRGGKKDQGESDKQKEEGEKCKEEENKEKQEEVIETEPRQETTRASND